MSEALKTKIKKVKVLLLDVDGVLTDGKIIVNDRGEETKNFNVQDGFGIVIFHRCGYRTAIISARGSKALQYRAEDLGIHKVYLDQSPKTRAYKDLKKAMKVKDDDIAFVCDDLTDLPVLKQVGFKVAVKNARPEIKNAADYTTKVNGGEGAVREVIELILKTHGKWNHVLKIFQ